MWFLPRLRFRIPAGSGGSHAADRHASAATMKAIAETRAKIAQMPEGTRETGEQMLLRLTKEIAEKLNAGTGTSTWVRTGERNGK